MKATLWGPLAALAFLQLAPTSHAAVIADDDPCDLSPGDPPYLCLPERLSAGFIASDPRYIVVPPTEESAPPPLMDPQRRSEDDPGVSFPGEFPNRIGSLVWDSPAGDKVVFAAFPQEEYVRLRERTSIRERVGETSLPFAENPQIALGTVWDYPGNGARSSRFRAGEPEKDAPARGQSPSPARGRSLGDGRVRARP